MLLTYKRMSEFIHLYRNKWLRVREDILLDYDSDDTIGYHNEIVISDMNPNKHGDVMVSTVAKSLTGSKRNAVRFRASPHWLPTGRS